MRKMPSYLAAAAAANDKGTDKADALQSGLKGPNGKVQKALSAADAHITEAAKKDHAT